MNARRYLTPHEAERLIEAAGQSGRYRQRDKTLALLLYRHGLRRGEAAALQWADLDLTGGTIHVRRLKHGKDSVQPLRGPELRALRQLRRDWPTGEYVFQSERGVPLHPRQIGRIIERAGATAGLPIKAHPHVLRHACGYYLANKGEDTRGIQAYLGHANIQNTVKYTELSANKFKDYFRD